MATRPLSSTTCSKFPRNIPLAGEGYPTNLYSTTAAPHPSPQLPARILLGPTGCQDDSSPWDEGQAARGFAACGAGSGGIGGAQRAQRASTARAPGRV